MNLGDLNFDASQVDPNVGFDVIPAGEYDAVITNSERKPTEKGGEILKLELQVISGEFQNRKLFDNLNIVNNGTNKEQTEQIAKGTLSAICRAVNVLTPKDSSELHLKPIRIKVGVEKRKDTGEDQNRIRSYKPRNSGPVTQQPVFSAPVQATEAYAPKTPW